MLQKIEVKNNYEMCGKFIVGYEIETAFKFKRHTRSVKKHALLSYLTKIFVILEAFAYFNINENED